MCLLNLEVNCVVQIFGSSYISNNHTNRKADVSPPTHRSLTNANLAFLLSVHLFTRPTVLSISQSIHPNDAWLNGSFYGDSEPRVDYMILQEHFNRSGFIQPQMVLLLLCVKEPFLVEPFSKSVVDLTKTELCSAEN